MRSGLDLRQVWRTERAKSSSSLQAVVKSVAAAVPFDFDGPDQGVEIPVAACLRDASGMQAAHDWRSFERLAVTAVELSPARVVEGEHLGPFAPRGRSVDPGANFANPGWQSNGTSEAVCGPGA